MPLLSAISQPGGAQRVAASLTSEPAKRMAPACAIRSRPLTVSRSGSPGPAPTNHTVPGPFPSTPFSSERRSRCAAESFSNAAGGCPPVPIIESDNPDRAAATDGSTG